MQTFVYEYTTYEIYIAQHTLVYAMAAVISPDDIRAMFAGLSRATIDVILRGARAEFMRAVRQINADGRPLVGRAVDIMEPFRVTPAETATCVVIGSPVDITAHILANGDDLEHTLRIPLTLTPDSRHIPYWGDWIEAVLRGMTTLWNPRIIRYGCITTCTTTDTTLRSPAGTVMFTDGGASDNGRAGCRASWAWIAVTPDGIVARGSGMVPLTPSNNRGELSAIGGAVAWIDSSGTTAATIVSDSKLSIDTLTKWVAGWLAEPKKLAKRKNLDLIVPIHEQLTRLAGRGVTVRFRHVNSHRAEPGDPEGRFLWRGNDIVDRECERLLTI